MAEKLGEAVLELRTDDSAFAPGIKKAERMTDGLGAKMDAFGSRARNAGALLSLGLTAPIVAFAAAAVDAAKESNEAMGQVEAALSSMGGAAGRTSEQLAELAAKQMRGSLYDDDEILRKVTANLLTFGNVAGDAFDRGQQAALDLSARLGQDLQSSAMMVGKALNDPVKGINALRRVGVSFSADQVEMVKRMAEVGDAAGAQALILKELERQFGGSAKAMREDDPAAALKMSFAEFQEEIGGKLLPLLPPLLDGLGGVLDVFGSLSPGAQTFTLGLLATTAAVGPLMIGVGSLVSGFGAMIPLFTALPGLIATVSTGLLALLANPIVLGAAAVIAGIYLAWQHWDKIQAIVDAVGAAVSGWWTGSVQPVLNALQAGLRMAADFFRDYFGGQFKAVTAMVSALIRGDFAGAWAAFKDFVVQSIAAAIRAFQALAPGAVASMQALYSGVKQWLQDRLGAVFDWLGQRVKQVGDFFYQLWDRVVGHSYVPDLVDGIEGEFARLNKAMVDPAAKATAKTAETFRALAERVQGYMRDLFPSVAINDDFDKRIADVEAWAKGKGADQGVAKRLLAGLQSQRADALKNAAPDFGSAGWSKARAGAAFAGIMGSASSIAEETKAAGQGFVAAMNDYLVAPAKKGALEIAEEFADLADNVLGSLDNIVGGFKRGDFVGALRGVLGLIGQVTGLIDGIGGAKAGLGAAGAGAASFGSSFAGFFAKGGTIPSGSWGIAGEAGPEPVFGPARVLPNSALRGMSGGGPRSLHVTVSGARGNAEIETMVRAGVEQGLVSYNEVAADSVQDHLARRG